MKGQETETVVGDPLTKSPKVPLYIAVGYFFASKIGGAEELTAMLLNSSLPKSTLAISTATSSVPGMGGRIEGDGAAGLF